MTLTRIPLVWRDPVAAFSSLKDQPFALLMHGAQKRWSYICANPVETLFTTPANAQDALDHMGNVSRDVAFERVGDAPPFCGGWAGMLSYEFGKTLLPRLEMGPERGAWPDLALGFYQEFIVFDHVKGRAEYWNWNWCYPAAATVSLLEVMARDGGTTFGAPLSRAPPKPQTARPDYEARIARTVKYVHAGDCFQSNISQRFDFELADGAHPYDLTRRLAQSSVAPFSAFLRLPGLALASNSPERFLKVRPDGEGRLKVSTKPIKGTRPRGKTPQEDAALAAELEASEKDRAENLMIVDLMRNDLSRVSIPGTVKVPRLHALESYANVHHLVSTVEAVLQPGKGPLDLIAAAFPGGSVTGAPKIRAMQIIAELEDDARGPYCGSLVWMTPDGWMDSSILIRSTALEQTPDGQWLGHYRSGGGIVADSVPADEYQETLDKALAMSHALTCPAHGQPRDVVFIGANRSHESVVNSRDRSFLLGDGCFETLRSVGEMIEGVDEHLRLLEESRRALAIAVGPETSALRKALNDLVCGLEGEHAIRITMSRGAGGRGADGGAADPVTVLSATPLHDGRPYPALTLATSTIRRNETSPLSRLKSTSYGDNLAARRQANAAGAHEALMLNMHGRVACLAMANVFLLTAQGVWVTPPEEEGARPGYMRGCVLKTLEERGMTVEIRPIEADELNATDISLFGTNSLWGMRPVKTIDSRPLKERLPLF